MFEEGVEGFFFRHRDTASLRQSLAKAVSLDAGRRREMGGAARARILRTAGWSAMMDRYLALFTRFAVDLRPLTSAIPG